MELLHRRCCGLDVHKATVVACLCLVADGKVATEVRTFQTTTTDLLARPLLPIKSESTESNLMLASSSVFCTRSTWLDCSRTNCLRVRSRLQPERR